MILTILICVITFSVILFKIAHKHIEKAYSNPDNSSQKTILEELITNNLLTDEEQEIVRKGRNAPSHKSKSTDIVTYHKATGFECLIGYLYQNNKDRLEEIMKGILK